MICRTPEEAFQAGWDSLCEHGVPDPADCPGCRLTPDETTRIAALMRPYLRNAEPASESAA